MSRKAVLAYFAERANDDGTGIWASKRRIAAEIECSKQTVISTINDLIADGLISKVGRRHNLNGYTVEYDLLLPAISALPAAKRSEQEVQISTGQIFNRSSSATSRGQTAGPKPSINRPTSQKTSSSSKAHPLPEDWTAPDLADLPSKARAIVQQWPRGAFEASCETFRLHWLSETRAIGRKSNWLAALGKWLINDHPKVMRGAKAGVSFEQLAPPLEATDPPPTAKPVPEQMVEGGVADGLRAALRKELGKRLYEQWFGAAALLVQDDVLRIVVSSSFSAVYIEGNFRPQLQRALAASGLAITSARAEVSGKAVTA